MQQQQQQYAYQPQQQQQAFPGTAVYVTQQMGMTPQFPQAQVPVQQPAMVMGCMDRRHVKFCWLEGMAAFVYVWVVAAARANGSTAVEFASFAYGAIIVGTMFAFCGATGNPAILLAGAFSRRIPVLAFLGAIICQLIGGLVAAVYVWYGLNGGTFVSMIPVLMPKNPQWVGFLAELGGTFIVIVVYLVSEGHCHKGARPIVIGLVIAAVGWAIAPITTSCLNPWYALCTSIVSGTWTSDTWIYYAGPFLASILGLLAIVLVGLRTRNSNFWLEYQAPAREKVR